MDFNLRIQFTDPVLLTDDPAVHFGFPRMVRARNRDLLLFYRVGTTHAYDDGIIGMRVSSDGGRTWSDQRILWNVDPGSSAHNPVALVAPSGRISPGMKHWRAWLPSTYYCTHALAPLMYITDTMPVKVNALSIACRQVDELTVRVADPGSVILCRMDNGAVFRIFGLVLPGHSNWYRVHGSRGAMEITRGPGYFGPGQIRVWHEEWNLKPGEEAERVYTPDWPEHGDLARQAGHGGGDFWTNFHFANAIRSGEPPYPDVYRGVAMSSVGILAWKSAFEDGRPFDVPNFKDEASRKQYENDHWSPWPEHAGPGQPPPSILGFLKPSPKGIELARQVWKEIGYDLKP